MKLHTYVVQGRIAFWGKKSPKAVIYIPVAEAKELREHEGKIVTVMILVPEEEVKYRWKRRRRRVRGPDR